MPSTQFSIPLVAAAVSTTASAPATGTINRYDSTSGALAPTLPALSGVSAGASLIVQKSDASANTVTITCTGGDTFDDGTTTAVLKSGDWRHLQAVIVGGTRNWKVIGSSTATSATKLVTAHTINGVGFDGGADITVTAAPIGAWSPAKHNIIAWAFDPAIIAANQVPASGTVWVVGLQVPAGTITNVILNVGTAGATLTSGQCFAGLYQGGTLLAATADQASSWVSTGLKTMALTTPQTVTAGLVYVALFSNGTTNPAFSRGSSSANTAANLGLASSASRYATADTGRTTSLASTLGTLAPVSTTVWAAVS